MATVYKIEIETVSAFINYPPEEIERIVNKMFKEYIHPPLGLKFENTKVNAIRKA